jgi:ABC-type glycerol-3-phosphate transport system permease component
VLFTFLFTPGIIPLYLMVKQLGMLDSYWALILPTAINVFNFVIVRGFVQNIPQELIDAARIDGAGEWRILWTIVTPLSRGVLAVVGLFYGVGYWNAYFNAVIYLNDTEKWPLQLIIRSFVLQGQSDFNNTTDLLPPPQEAMQMALLVVSIIPILIVYPFLQRHLKKGVLTGAVKG